MMEIWTGLEYLLLVSIGVAAGVLLYRHALEEGHSMGLAVAMAYNEGLDEAEDAYEEGFAEGLRTAQEQERGKPH